MRKLYLKIVLAIWTVMIVSSATAIFVATKTMPSDASRAEWDSRLGRILVPMLTVASNEATGKGEVGLIESVRKNVFLRPGLSFRLVDSSSRVILSFDAPGVDARKFSDLRSSSVQSFEFEHDNAEFVFVVASSDRIPKAHIDKPGWQRLFAFLAFRSVFFWVAILVAVSLSILLSVAIARYLVKPLSSFEQASQRLSAGDFSARVGPSVTRRGDEIAEFAGTFDQMAARIEVLVRSHKDLLRDVSHELRSPLARALAALSLARQRTKGAVDGELNRIELEIDRLNALIQKLLTYSRLDSKEVSHQSERIDIKGLMDDIVAVFPADAIAEDKSIVLHSSGPHFVTGDSELLTGCFENIVRNAARHTPPKTTIEVSIFEPDEAPGHCQIDFRDYGEGVPSADLEQIFEPFHKVAGAGSSEAGREGIGLAIVKKAVSIHGGSVSAQNVEGGGLLISVRLPTAD